MENKKLLLRTEHLVKEFPIGGTKKNPLVVHAVSDVNLEIYEGETLALDRKSTRLNSSHPSRSRMPSSA